MKNSVLQLPEPGVCASEQQGLVYMGSGMGVFYSLVRKNQVLW